VPAVVFRMCRCGSWERNPPCAECVERERLRAEWRAAQAVKGKGRSGEVDELAEGLEVIAVRL
jgi:hypothetical protein